MDSRSGVSMKERMRERYGKNFDKLYYKQKRFLKFGRKILSLKNDLMNGNFDMIFEETEEELKEIEELEKVEREIEMLDEEYERILGEIERMKLVDEELKKLEKESEIYELERLKVEEMNEFLKIEIECCEIEVKKSKSKLKKYFSIVGDLVWKEMFGLGCKYG